MPTLILQIADYIPDFGDVTDGLICINISARQHTAHETYYQLCHLQFSLFFLHPASCFLLCNTQCSLTEADSDYFCFLSCSVHNNVWLLLGDIISTCQFRVTCWPIPSSCIILLPPPSSFYPKHHASGLQRLSAWMLPPATPSQTAADKLALWVFINITFIFANLKNK